MSGCPEMPLRGPAEFAAAAPAENMIDDFEDGEVPALPMIGGRNGAWITTPQLPPPGQMVSAETSARCVASGGTAGDVGLAVLRATRTGGWRVALALSGYKLGLFRLGGDLASSRPIYRKNDPNCCPTGGFEHIRYHWNGKRFVVARSWRTRRSDPRIDSLM